VGQKVTRNQLLGTVNGSVSILAQRSGEVASIDKNIGDYISVEDRIGLISGSDPKKIVRFTIPASWKNISRGDSLDISWRPDFAIGTGSITGISSVINQKGGYQAQADISEETPFPIGASVRIIPNNSKKGVFVQRKSIVFENAQPYVWLVTENDIIRKQKVTPGRSLGEYVEIISGIERGFSYLVVLDPTVDLENGVSITEIIKEIRVVGISDSTHDESVPHVH
jgi:hypothetical protein